MNVTKVQQPPSRSMYSELLINTMMAVAKRNSTKAPMEKANELTSSQKGFFENPEISARIKADYYAFLKKNSNVITRII